MRPILAWCFAALGVAAMVATTGWSAPSPPAGMRVVEGRATVVGGELLLDAGAVVELGEGRSLSVTGSFAGREMDLVRSGGPGQSSRGRVGEVAGIYADSGQVLGNDPPTSLSLGARSTVSLTCDGMVVLVVDGRRAAGAPPVPNCDRPGVLRVAAVTPVEIQELVVDKRALPIVAASPPPARLAAAAGLGAVLAVVLGPVAAAVLLLSPAALLAARMGLPVDGVLALVWSAAASVGLSSAVRWRRWAAGGLVALGLGGAGLSTWRASQDDSPPGWLAERAGWATIDVGLLRRKVDIVVRRARTELARGDDRPLVVALGSSSSGGGTHGQFWPQMLAATLPGIHVVNLAEGGATTWHMVEVVEALDLRPSACVLYMGHNDVAPSLPGLTARQLVEGATPQAGAWLPPVPVEDLPALLSRLVERCEVALVMHEYEQRTSDQTDDWIAAAQGTPGVVYRDPWPLFLAGGPGFMVDEVHPSAVGQAALAAFVAGELAPLLAAHGHPEAAVARP